MRKYRRNLLRSEARKEKCKESRFIKHLWNHKQMVKFGNIGRTINMAKGTHKKKNWGYRIDSALNS